MRSENRSVTVSSKDWQTHGGRMMKWIKTNLGEDCYRLRFSGHSKPVRIEFEDPTQAFAFNLCVLFAGLQVLE